MNSTVQYNKAKKNTLVSGNAGDEKNLHPGGRNVFFLIDVPEIFYFLFIFYFLIVCLFFACPADFQKQDVTKSYIKLPFPKMNKTLSNTLT